MQKFLFKKKNYLIFDIQCSWSQTLSCLHDMLITVSCSRVPCVNRHSHSFQEWGLIPDYRCLLLGFWACNHIECMKNEIKSKPYFCTVLKFILRTDHLPAMWRAVQCVNLPLPWIGWCSIFASVGPTFSFSSLTYI